MEDDPLRFVLAPPGLVDGIDTTTCGDGHLDRRTRQLRVRVQAATDALLAEHPDLSERLGKEDIAVRDLLVHRIEEYARHCGQADLLRKCIDGRVGQ